MLENGNGLEKNNYAILPETMNLIEMVLTLREFTTRVNTILDGIKSLVVEDKDVRLSDEAMEEYKLIIGSSYLELDELIKILADSYLGLMDNWKEILNIVDDNNFALADLHFDIKLNLDTLGMIARANGQSVTTTGKQVSNVGAFFKFSSKATQVARDMRQMFSHLQEFLKTLSQSESISLVTKDEEVFMAPSVLPIQDAAENSEDQNGDLDMGDEPEEERNVEDIDVDDSVDEEMGGDELGSNDLVQEFQKPYTDDSIILEQDIPESNMSNSKGDERDDMLNQGNGFKPETFSNAFMNAQGILEYRRAKVRKVEKKKNHPKRIETKQYNRDTFYDEFEELKESFVILEARLNMEGIWHNSNLNPMQRNKRVYINIRTLENKLIQCLNKYLRVSCQELGLKYFATRKEITRVAFIGHNYPAFRPLSFYTSYLHEIESVLEQARMKIVEQ